MGRGHNSLFGLPLVDKWMYIGLDLAFIDEVKSSLITALVDMGADVNLIGVSFLKELFLDINTNAKMEEKSL